MVLNDNLSGFGDQELRDLEWTVSSPLLLNPETPGVAVPEGNGFPVADHSKDLMLFLSERRSHRVGRYFEDLVEFWLHQGRQCRFIAKNRQVSDGGKTLGELDFVFEEPGGARVHWEVAVKFYLAIEGRFVGPNARDTLDLKWKRMFQHQLPLGERVYPDLHRREVFVKGIIFYHFRDSRRIDSGLLNPSHLAGTWARENDVADCLREWRGREFQILEKPFWLGASVGRKTSYGAEKMADYLARHFAGSRRPVLLSVGVDGDEVGRLFVVENAWPGDFPAEIA